MKIIYDFKNHCLHLSSEDEFYEMYSRTYYMLKSLRKDYAVKICNYYKIEYSDVDNDYITIFGLKHSLDKNLLSLLSSIEAIKASEKFTNSIPESNDLNRKILTKNTKQL